MCVPDLLIYMKRTAANGMEIARWHGNKLFAIFFISVYAAIPKMACKI